jgi:hypothetical protein
LLHSAPFACGGTHTLFAWLQTPDVQSMSSSQLDPFARGLSQVARQGDDA